MANEITSIKIGNVEYPIDFSKHTHSQYATVEQLNESELTTAEALNDLDTKLDGKSESDHIHDERYYTETEVNNLLAGKANSSHGNHVPTTQTANNTIFLRNDNTWATITPANIGAADASHTHAYLPLTGGTLTGPLKINNTTNTSEQSIIFQTGADNEYNTYDFKIGKFKDSDDVPGFGFAMNLSDGAYKKFLKITSGGQYDVQSVDILTALKVSNYTYSKGFVKDGSSGSYVLTGNGGHKAVSDFATAGHTHKFTWNNNDTNLETILGNLQSQITANANAISNKSDIHDHNYISSTTTRAKNTVLAGPTTGSDKAPTFRALVAADIPDLSSSYISSTTSRTKNYVLAAPSSANGAPSFRALVAADIPSLAASKITSGTFAIGRIPTGTTSTTVALGNHTHSQYATVEQLDESELATAEALTDLDTRVDALESNGGGVKNALNTTSKAFLIGTTTTPTSTQSQITTTISDTGVYLTASAGGLQATTIYASSGFFQETYSSSDERLKTFTEDIIINFEKLKSIRKKYFYWNDNNSDLQLGVSAQDIKEVYPEIVTENPETKYLSVDYSKLSVISLAAVDKLHEENVQLKEENEQLKTRLDNLEAILKEKGIL